MNVNHFRYGALIPYSVMSAADPKTYLWKRIESLMGGVTRTIDQVVAHTNISRGSIQRVREGKTSTGTDILVQLAEAFDLEVWELLQPPTDESHVRQVAKSSGGPEARKEQALAILKMAAALSPDARKSTADALGHYLLHPETNADMLPILVARLSGEFPPKAADDEPKAA